MSKEGREIRGFLDDLNEYAKVYQINEAYIFNKEEGDDANSIQQNNDSIKEPINDNPEIETSGIGVDEKIEQIRKIAIKSLADLDPGINPDSYKLIKNIWDSCDKYLIKDQKAPKQQLNNEINK